jgi:hypothetical protein
MGCRQIVALAIKGFLSTWRKLFGSGMAGWFVARRKMLAENVNGSSAGFQEKELVFIKIALESTLPPHSDGAARQV